jgi:hypothetical protein
MADCQLAHANQQLEIGIVTTEEGFRKSAIGNWQLEIA